MTNSPDEIRADIEQTRTNLSNDVDALTDEANPKNMAKRQASKAKGAAVGLKDKVMGSASDVGDSASGAAESIGDAVSGAPDKVRDKAEGHPLAAGLIAFGAGLLVASMFPASQREERAAAAVKDNLEPVKQQATEIARESAEHLKEPAQEAAAKVRDTAEEAAQTVKDEGSTAAGDVQGQAQEAKGNVQDTRN